ncbi:hypothetical protein [Mucilaginibacter ginkgonis]|uniref:Uncharacterized protein n=1 Tax=Mucilaginibacter ginkgonis TaxID=2682091 RepID=A0A6I4HWQ5_9SPHI|nr:hypothetical protein [Mucilaginibacter ginkgonis]QQL49967.1 hypothetical protein GO620_000510 [Mucilaginibacter ginkgonis]
MKNIKAALVLIHICMIAAACHNAESSIAGSYVTQTKNEYFQTVDTLIDPGTQCKV